MIRVSLVLVTILVAIASGPLSAQSDADRTEIRRVAMRQADTWNLHDAKSYAALFTKDCDVVNVVGWWWRGRDELERKLTQAFQTVFRDSRLTITDINTRFLRPDVAVAHARWTMTGARTPPGMPEPKQGIQTLVFTRQSGGWLISAFQNTISLPERPFTAPPAGAEAKSP